MGVIAISFVTGLILSLILGVLLFFKNSQRTYGQRILLCIFPISFYFLIYIYSGIITTIPLWHWASYRLSATSALAKGLNIYSSPNSGSVFGWIYGPISPCLYLPALLFNSITMQHIIAGVINAVLLIFPLFYLTFVRCRKNFKQRVIGLLGFLFASAAIIANETTIYFLKYLPADTSAVSFGLLSCCLLLNCKNELSFKNLFFAALFFNISIFSKQTEIFIIFIQVIYILIIWNMNTVLKYIGLLIIICIIFSLISVANFGLDNLIFSMFIIPGHHPWETDLKQLSKLFIPLYIPLLVILWISFISCIHAFREWKGLSSFLLKRPWLFLLSISIVMLPISIFGRMKIGGDVNTFHSIYYLIATVALLFVETNISDTKNKVSWNNRQLVILYLAIIILCPWNKINFNSFWSKISKNQLEEAYGFAVTHPGEVYFPWYPIVNVMVDNKLYHYSYGIYDRELAGYKIDRELFLANIPPKMKYIVFASPDGSFFEGIPSNKFYRSTIMKFCPEFSIRVFPDNLSSDKWIILSKNEP